jgi:hypothetical protein
MAKQINTQPLVQITDPDFAAGFINGILRRG